MLAVSELSGAEIRLTEPFRKGFCTNAKCVFQRDIHTFASTKKNRDSPSSLYAIRKKEKTMKNYLLNLAFSRNRLLASSTTALWLGCAEFRYAGSFCNAVMRSCIEDADVVSIVFAGWLSVLMR